MGKRWRIGAPILLAMLATALVWTMSKPQEPVYFGKSINYWLGAAKPELGSNGQIRFLLLQLPKANTNALPALVRALNKKDGMPQHIHAFVWRNSPTWMQMRMQLPPPDGIIRVRAVEWLQELGEQASPAIPSLIQVMKNDADPGVRTQVPRALMAIDRNDPAVRQALNEAAKGDDAPLKAEVLKVLKP